MFDTHDIFAANNNGDMLLYALAGGRYIAVSGTDARQENNKRLSALDVAMAYGKQGSFGDFQEGGVIPLHISERCLRRYSICLLYRSSVCRDILSTFKTRRIFSHAERIYLRLRVISPN